MQYLLDTHVLLWWLVDPTKLSVMAKCIIEDKNNSIFVSSVSVWELVIKKDLRNLTIPSNLLATLKSEQIQILPFGAEEALAITDLPKIHSDPFDRALISQAKVHDLIFITKDRKILEYPIVAVEA